MKKIYITIIVIFALMVCFGVQARADIRDLGAGTLIDVGIMEFKRGNLQMAAHEFSKALMIQPNNEEAKIWLDKCGFAKGLYSSDGEQIERVDIKTTEVRMTKVAGKDFAYPTNVYDVQPGSDLNAQMNDRIEADLHYLSQEVSQLKWDLQQGSLVTAREFFPPVNIEVPLSVQEEYERAIEQAFEHEQEIYKLDEKYAHLRKRSQYLYVHQDKLIHVLEDYLHQREGALNYGKDELIMKELSMAKMIKQLLTKLDEVMETQDSINQYLSRVDDDAAFLRRQKEVKSIRTRLSIVSAELANRDVVEINRKIQLGRLEQVLKSTEEEIMLLTAAFE